MMRYLLLLLFILPAFIANAQQSVENCYNGIDDDGDGLVDCADANCAFASECSSESANFNCSDGIDNDGDGKVDCADEECDCASVEICNNGLDDDGDGLVDYYDGDCFATLRQQDSLALVALYHATDGDNWTKNDNWLTGPLDTWHGITIGNYGIWLVWLENNNLVGTIPSEIGSLSAEQLDLSYNQLSGNIPSELGDMPRLDSLSLRKNALNGQIPNKLVDTGRTYTIIDLSSNLLSGSLPQSMKDATYSHSLDLSSNYLSVITKSSWSGKGNITINENSFTFQDILMIFGRDRTTYKNQRLVGRDTVVNAEPGQSYTMRLNIDQYVYDNQYVWFRDQVAFDTTNINEYILNNMSANDAGTYICEVTNPRVEGLRLYSHPTIIQVQDDRQPQTITFDSIANRTYGDSSFVLRASASSGLPVRYQITEGEGTVITLKDSIVTIVGTGSAAIIALQDGDEAFRPATAVIRRFNVDKLPQKITFVQLDSAWVGDTLTLVASSDASLPVSFSVSGPARLEADRLVLTGEGQVTVTATQAGNEAYLPAEDAVQTITVEPPLYSLSGQVFQGEGILYTGVAAAVLYPSYGLIRRGDFRQQLLDEQGTYRFDSLKAGRYVFKVSVRSEKYIPTYWGGHYLIIDAGSIPIRRDTIIDVTLLSAPERYEGTAIIRGRLVSNSTNGRTSQAGDSFAEISVFLRNTQTGELVAFAVTNEAGEFEFTNLPEGEYSFVADYEGLATGKNTVRVSNNQETVITVTVADEITVALQEAVITSLNERDKTASIRVFPNPVNDHLRIEATGPSWIGATVRLQNTLGNTVDETVIQHALTTLDVSDQKVGIYLLTVKRGSLIETQKIVKW